MNAKKHPDYIEKKVKLGDEELVLYSLDGQTWTSRPDELEVIKERRETGKVTMEKKGPAAKPTMRRMLPKRSNSNSANREGEDGIISTVSGRRLPALIPGTSGASSRKGTKKSKQIDKEESAMTPEPKDIGNEKDETAANSGEQKMKPLNSEQPLADEGHQTELKPKAKPSSKSKGSTQTKSKSATSAARATKKSAGAKKSPKKASSTKAKAAKSKTSKSPAKKSSSKPAAAKKASRVSAAKKKTASKTKSKPAARSKKPATAQKKTAKKVVSKKSSVKKKPAKKK